MSCNVHQCIPPCHGFNFQPPVLTAWDLSGNAHCIWPPLHRPLLAIDSNYVSGWGRRRQEMNVWSWNPCLYSPVPQWTVHVGANVTALPFTDLFQYTHFQQGHHLAKPLPQEKTVDEAWHGTQTMRPESLSYWNFSDQMACSEAVSSNTCIYSCYMVS